MLAKKRNITVICVYLLVSGKVVPKKDVIEIVRRFNIQVNNLTQVSSYLCSKHPWIVVDGVLFHLIYHRACSNFSSWYYKWIYCNQYEFLCIWLMSLNQGLHLGLPSCLFSFSFHSYFSFWGWWWLVLATRQGLWIC